jgi:hypothetical protein
VRTTLTIDDDIAAKLNAEMKRSGRSLKDTINRALRIGLSVQRELKSSSSFKVRSKPLGVRTGLNYDKIELLLEGIEGPLHR